MPNLGRLQQILQILSDPSRFVMDNYMITTVNLILKVLILDRKGATHLEHWGLTLDPVNLLENNN